MASAVQFNAAQYSAVHAMRCFLTWKAMVKAFSLKWVGGVGHGFGITSTMEGMPVSISACARLTAVCTPKRPSPTTHPSPRRMPRTSGLRVPRQERGERERVVQRPEKTVGEKQTHLSPPKIKTKRDIGPQNVQREEREPVNGMKNETREKETTHNKKKQPIDWTVSACNNTTTTTNICVR